LIFLSWPPEAPPPRDELDELAAPLWDEDDGLHRELREWRPVAVTLELESPARAPLEQVC